MTKSKIALVLSGGGARGLAHIGVIEELERRGYEIGSIAGTSMGSMVGGVYATGGLDAFKQWFYALDRAKVFRLVDFSFRGQGLVKADRVLRKLQEYVPDVPIESLSVPFAAVAVDLVSKEEVVFRSGSLYDAIRASIAIPSVITPVKRDGQVLVDGGVLNNLPMSHIQRQKGDIMMAVYVNADVPVREPAEPEEHARRLARYQHKIRDFYQQLRRYDFHLGPFHRQGQPGGEAVAPDEPFLPLEEHVSREKEDSYSYFSLISRTLDVMTMHMAQEKMKQFAPEILVKVSRDSCGVYDFYKAEQQVEEGRLAAIEALDAYEAGYSV